MKLEELTTTLDDIDHTESLHEWFMKQEEKRKAKRKLVSSREYIDWVYNNLSSQNGEGFSDEDFAYSDDPNKDKGVLLSQFLDYIHTLAVEQRVLNVPDKENGFETLNYVINIKDKYFAISMMCGQGSITFISEVQKPNHCCVRLNEED